MSGTLPQENSYVHGSVTNIFTEEDFNDLEEIATGGEAICFRAFSPRFGEVCTKIFHSPAMKTGLKKELEIFLKHSDHPNLIRFFGFYENNYRKSERIGYVMEYMPGGSLHDIIYSHERYTFANACNWMAQAARGLDYLHRARIIHRDVKPKNMLLDRHRETLKLSDFGLAKTLDHTTFDSNNGTFPYMAPEVFECGDGNTYSYPVDVYALGITFWEILHRREPYLDKSFALPGKVIRGERPQFQGEFDPIMVNLLQRSWSHVPQSRCSVMEMIDYTSRNGIVQYHQASTQQPAPVHTYSQPNNLSIQREQPGRIGTIPQPAKRVKQYMLQGPSDSLCLPKFPRTMMSQITYELIAFFFPLCPHKFPNAIEVMHNLALQCAQHLDDPNGNNNAMKAIGFTQNGQTIESEALPQLIAEASLDDSAIMDSTDFNAFIWPRKNIFILVYYAKHVNECTATKIDAFLNLLTELERRYDSCQQEVRTFLNDRKFNCLIVGDWKQSRKIFDRLKSGYNAGETHNLMSLYDMNYHFYRVAKTTCISHAAYGIVEKIAEIGQVHKIIYLMDTSYGYGKFDDSWEQLFKRINATIWLVVELQDGENVLERAKQEKQKLANCSTFRGNVEVYTLFTNGQDFLKNYTWDFCTIFSWNYADCINKLVLDISPLSVFEIVGHSEI